MYILTLLRFLYNWKVFNTNTLSILSKRYLRINKHCPTQRETSYRKVLKDTVHEPKTQVDIQKWTSEFDIFAFDCVLIQGLACRE